jgi:hypothetical protein
VFQRAYRHELETKLSQKPWRQEIANTPDWPRRKAVAEFRVCVGHDCLGTHLHRIGIRPDPFCMLCSLREPMDRNHLGQWAALTKGTECERYWEARTKIMEGWLRSLLITITTSRIAHWWTINVPAIEEEEDILQAVFITTEQLKVVKLLRILRPVSRDGALLNRACYLRFGGSCCLHLHSLRCAQTLKIKTASSCELAVVYQSTRRHILGDLTLHQYR